MRKYEDGDWISEEKLAKGNNIFETYQIESYRRLEIRLKLN